MDVVLIETKMSGMKSMNKEIKLSFTKKIFDNNILNTSHIKTIYGTNGSGKSGIVHGFDFYKYLLLNDFPFKDQFYISRYSNMINKKTSKFTIENTFAILIDEKMLRFSHSLIVQKDSEGSLKFAHEKLISLDERLKAMNTVFEIADGKPIILPKTNQTDYSYDQSTLEQNSFVHLFSKNIPNNKIPKNVFGIFCTMFFCVSLVVSFGSKDDAHESVDLNSLLSMAKDTKFTITMSGIKIVQNAINNLKGENYAWIISRKEEDEYKKITKKFSLFLKKLNTKIRNVKINFKHDGSTVSYCELKFCYPGYDVDYEFESTGIKKLCALFLAFYKATKNNIVIIDEVDAGIHDIFLKNLIEYFALYTDCQLIMTTHHIELMEIVNPLSKSIDILTDDCKIEQWKKSGDYSPASLYKKGYLHGTPFNLNPFDFSEIFGDN